MAIDDGRNAAALFEPVTDEAAAPWGRVFLCRGRPRPSTYSLAQEARLKASFKLATEL